MVPNSTEYRSRRTVLKAASALGIGGLAGCTGGGGGGGGDGGDGGGGDGGGGDGGYSMTLAGPYTMDAMANYVPMMFEEYKSNVESETDGEVTVEFAPAGELGAGTELAQKVQQGTVEAAQFSMSNFAPFAPAVDLVNLPYFAGTNQKFVNLVTSDTWQEKIHAKVRDKGYEIGYYAVVDPRSIAPGPKFPQEQFPPRTPADMEGITHRTPGSDMLDKAWSMIGANPSPINWGETTQALEEGTADSTHNALEFHPAFGFTDIIQAEVLIKAVEDAQVIALNKEWYDGLPDDLQSAMDAAGQQTFEANLEALSDRRANSVEELRSAGVEFVELSEDERQQWIDAMGYQRSEWDQFKTDLAGDMETFKQFEEAANTKSDFDVSPQTIPE
jgi:TRAP-type C4-dicarboxylate transport system substrate-binding protein